MAFSKVIAVPFVPGIIPRRFAGIDSKIDKDCGLDQSKYLFDVGWNENNGVIHRGWRFYLVAIIGRRRCTMLYRMKSQFLCV